MKIQIAILTLLLLPYYLLAQVDDSEDLYMDAFIVIADSSMDYFEIRTKMLDLSIDLNIGIDTMGRGFDKSKNLICLSENDSDEIYAGNYFPRRYPSEKLSLEYLDYYRKGTEIKGIDTIILVVGILDNKKQAKALLNRIKLSKAYILETKIYMGCMH